MANSWPGRCDCCGENTLLMYVDREGCETCRACHDGGQCSCHGIEVSCGKAEAIKQYPELAIPEPDVTLGDDVEAAIRSITGQEPMT